MSTVLQPIDYTDEVWSDSILRAMILRAAVADELVYVDPTEEAKRTVQARGLITRPERDEHSVLLEVLLAAGLEKVDLKVDEELRAGVLELIDPASSAYATVEYMLDRIEADQNVRRARALGTSINREGTEDDRPAS